MSLALCDCVCVWLGLAMPSRAVYGEKSMCERACANPIYYFTLCFLLSLLLFCLEMEVIILLRTSTHSIAQATVARTAVWIVACSRLMWYDAENGKLEVNIELWRHNSDVYRANAFAICIDFYWLNRSMCVSHFEQLPIELIWCVWKGAAVAIDIHRSQFTISFGVFYRRELTFDLCEWILLLRRHNFVDGVFDGMCRWREHQAFCDY